MIARPIRPVALLAILVVAIAACSTPAGSAVPTAAPSESAALAGGCPAEQPEALPPGETRTVTLDTTKGPIVIKVEADLSPMAAGNFVALAECGFYDGVVFHRAATLEDGTPFVIQGGDPDGTGGGGPGYTIQDEPVTATYGRGTVAMARTAEPNSVGSQFFIVLDDGARDVLAAYNTYQIIGAVSEGMESADAIYEAAGGVELPAQPESMTSVSVSNP
jgi:cyclophilin family peptidyl-prolyl cis-trans isomerase